MIRIRVPCSTSNLGSGFDCIGLAFDRYLRVEFVPGGDALHVTRSGTLADIGDPADDIIGALLRDHGAAGQLHLHSDIPVGRGLGSSAAATVAGLAILSALQHEELNVDVALRRATSLEGHPDNSAPALIGGLVAVVGGGDVLRAIPLHLSEDIGFVFAAPQTTVATNAARRALPDQVPHAVATRAISRSVALVEGLAEGDPELLRIGFSDDLHVPFRAAMIPGCTQALDAAVRAGAWAATISGSGSGIVAVCAKGQEDDVAMAAADAFESASSLPAIAFPVAPDFDGLQMESNL